MCADCWWEQIQGPKKYIDAIFATIARQESVCLFLPKDTPWRYEMIQLLIMNLRREQGYYKPDPIDDNLGREPGDIILDEYCSEESKNKFRSRKGYARFFANDDTCRMHSRIVIIEAKNKTRLNKWIRLAKEYHCESRERRQKGLYIIISSQKEVISSGDGLVCLSYEEYVSLIDCYLMNLLMITSQNGLSDGMIRYGAQLALDVCKKNVELSADILCTDINGFLNNPYKMIESQYNMYYNQGLIEEKTEIQQRDIERSIWRAQHTVIYPILEDYREQLVDKYYDAISSLLPIKALYGDKIEDPYSFDLGLLYYYRISLHLTEHELEKLEYFHKMRNKLAHLAPLSFSDVKRLLKGVRRI